VKTLLDPVRRKRVAWTPEEEVRQGLIQYLIGPVGIPLHSLRVELSLSAFDLAVRDRVDLVAYHQDRPVLLCECKAPSVDLTPGVSAQLRRYLRLLPAPWVLQANGRNFRLHRLSGDVWCECDGFLPWTEMVVPCLSQEESGSGRFGKSLDCTPRQDVSSCP
jgi:hypothetical protein